MCLEVTRREPMGAREPAAGGALVSIFEETGGGLSAVAHDRSLELFVTGMRSSLILCR
jgi:hypothetical protein